MSLCFRQKRTDCPISNKQSRSVKLESSLVEVGQKQRNPKHADGSVRVPNYELQTSTPPLFPRLRTKSGENSFPGALTRCLSFPRLHIDIAPIYSITVLRRSNQIYGGCDRLSRGLIIFCYQSALSPGPLAPKCQLFGNQQQQSSV